MKNKLVLILAAVILTSCSVEFKTSFSSKKTKEIDGVKYTLVRNASQESEYISNIELWEKEGDTNRYYTPSLTGNYMVPIMR
jgi:hypothetical protein